MGTTSVCVCGGARGGMFSVLFVPAAAAVCCAVDEKEHQQLDWLSALRHLQANESMVQAS